MRSLLHLTAHRAPTRTRRARPPPRRNTRHRLAPRVPRTLSFRLPPPRPLRSPSHVRDYCTSSSPPRRALHHRDEHTRDTHTHMHARAHTHPALPRIAPLLCDHLPEVYRERTILTKERASVHPFYAYATLFACTPTRSRQTHVRLRHTTASRSTHARSHPRPTSDPTGRPLHARV